MVVCKSVNGSTNRLAMLMVATALTLVGCSPKPTQRVAVSGRVTLDGRPLDRAVIRFVPTVSKGNRQTGAEVIHGEYAISAEDGVSVGRNRVEFGEYHPPDFDAEVFGRSHGASQRNSDASRIPERYSRRSDLFVTVPETGVTKFDFDLRSKP